MLIWVMYKDRSIAYGAVEIRQKMQFQWAWFDRRNLHKKRAGLMHSNLLHQLLRHRGDDLLHGDRQWCDDDQRHDGGIHFQYDAILHDPLQESEITKWITQR